MSDEQKFGPTGRRIELPARYAEKLKKPRVDVTARPQRSQRSADRPTCGCVEARHPATGAVVSVVKFCSRHRPAPLSAAGKPKEVSRG